MQSTTTPDINFRTCLFDKESADNIGSQVDDKKMKVYCRLTQSDGDRKIYNPNKVKNKEILWISESCRVEDYGSKFSNDRIFSNKENNQEIFETMGRELITMLVEKNLSSTIFLNGVSGSGKTHTLFGDKRNKGLAHLCYEELERLAEKNEFKIFCSLFKCDDDKLKDMIDNKEINIKVFRSEKPSTKEIGTPKDFRNLLDTFYHKKIKKSEKAFIFFRIWIKTKTGKEVYIQFVDFGFPEDKPLITIRDFDCKRLSKVYSFHSLEKVVTDVHTSFEYLLYYFMKNEKDLRKCYFRKGQTCLAKLIVYELCVGHLIRVITHINQQAEVSENITALVYTEIIRRYYVRMKNRVARRSEVCDSMNDKGKETMIENNLIIEEEENDIIEKRYQTIKEKFSSSNVKQLRSNTVNARLEKLNEKKNQLPDEEVKLKPEEKVKIQKEEIVSRNQIPDSEVERMKLEYKNLVEKFEEQEKLIKTLQNIPKENPRKQNPIQLKDFFDALPDFCDDTLKQPNTMIIMNSSIGTINIVNLDEKEEKSVIENTPKKLLISPTAKRKNFGTYIDKF